MPSIARAALAAAMFSILATKVFADAAADADAPEEIVVVATRSPQSLDKIGNSVTVLDQQAIQASQKITVSELLATTPGITTSSAGGPGNITSVYIRGADSDHTVVLIDGVVFNDPSQPAGNLDFGNLLLGDVSRIEIVRGGQSTLYGSQAIGGVINIITAEPGPGLGGNVQAEFGNLDTGLAKGGIGGKFDNWSFRVGSAYYSTQSIPALDTVYGGTITDPFHETVVSGRATYDFTSDVQLDLRAYWTESQNYYDGTPPPLYVLANDTQYQTVREIVNYTGLNFALFGGALENRLAYQFTTTQRADYNDAGTAITENDSYRGNNGRVEYQGTWAIAEGYRAVFGAQQEKSWIDTTPYPPAEANTGSDGEYLQLQGEVAPGLTLTAGERHDHYDTFGQHYTGQFAAAWSLPSATILRASWSQGYKAPSLYQLYSPYGNSALNPEQSNGGDVGVEQRLWDERIKLSATYFITNFKNLIEFDSCPGNPECPTLGLNGGYYANVDRARADGVELQAEASLTPALVASLNYSHIRSVDRTIGSPTYDQQLYQRPQDAANASLGYTWANRLNTSISARFSSYSLDENFDGFPATVRLGGYTLLYVRGSYPLTDALELYGRIDNATNKSYETVYQYGNWRRTVFVGLRAKL
jgi:vitamin B12 transporter